MRHLGVLGPLVGGQRGHADGGNHLVFRQRGYEGVLNEIGHRHGPPARRPLYDRRAAQSRQHRSPVRRRVGVGQVAADRPPVPHRRVANAARRLRQQPVGLPHLRRRRNLGVGRQRADGNDIPADGYAPQTGNPANVNQQLRPRQPEPHQRNQAVAPRQQPRLRVLRQQLHGLRHGAGLAVFKLCCKHCNQSSSSEAG